jgi:ankyrin repeat protein
MDCILRYYVEVARILLEYGADATVQDKDGRTPFNLVSSGSGLKEVEDILLQHRANLESCHYESID